VLASCYSTNCDLGYYHAVHCFPIDKEDEYYEEVCKDPTEGDNNNGITVIDLSGDKIKYCFLSIDHLECLDSEIDLQQEQWEATKMGQAAYINFYPISADRWLELHYKGKKMKVKDPEYLNYIKATLANLSKFEVLTTQELAKIFPSLKEEFKKAQKESKYLNPKSVQYVKKIAVGE
jgi:hypothetical protein